MRHKWRGLKLIRSNWCWWSKKLVFWFSFQKRNFSLVLNVCKKFFDIKYIQWSFQIAYWSNFCSMQINFKVLWGIICSLLRVFGFSLKWTNFTVTYSNIKKSLETVLSELNSKKFVLETFMCSFVKFSNRSRCVWGEFHKIVMECRWNARKILSCGKSPFN